MVPIESQGIYWVGRRRRVHFLVAGDSSRRGLSQSSLISSLRENARIKTGGDRRPKIATSKCTRRIVCLTILSDTVILHRAISRNVRSTLCSNRDPANEPREKKTRDELQMSPTRKKKRRNCRGQTNPMVIANHDRYA